MNIIETMVCPEKAELYATPNGNRYMEKFIGKLDMKTGNIVLMSAGKVDLYEQIQSYAEETDLALLVERAVNGDLSVFKSAVFGDFTDMPQSYGEALNCVIEAEREFNSLPQEIKDKFNNDWHKYLVSAGTNEWYEKFGAVKNDVADQKEDVADQKEVDLKDEQKQ